MIHGEADVGQTLRAYSGVWAGAGLAIDYRWQRCRASQCEAVGEGRAFRVRRQDRGYRLRLVLTAAGVASPSSVSTAVVPEAPRNTARPSISGRAVVGAVLVGHRGSWTGSGIGFDYRWIRCRPADCSQGTTVSETGTYRVRESDRGRRLRLVVAAANVAGRTTASSRPSATIRRG